MGNRGVIRATGVQGVALPGDQRRGPHEQERRERGLGKGATMQLPEDQRPTGREKRSPGVPSLQNNVTSFSK